MSDPTVPSPKDDAKEVAKKTTKAPAKATKAAGAAAAPAGEKTAASKAQVHPAEPVAPAAQQPIFVQAPEAPLVRGNRLTAGLIGLIAAASFGVLYLIAIAGLSAFSYSDFVMESTFVRRGFGDTMVSALGSWVFWMPVVTFFLGFWLLGAIINRGRWGTWVIFGLLVGVAAYGGFVLGFMVQEQFWTRSAEVTTVLAQEAFLSPLAIVALVLGRELTIWFGAWVARIGTHKEAQNAEAKREYEHKLEAGPVLSR